MSQLVRILLLALLATGAASHAAAGVTEGAIAPAGDCARAPELPPAGPARSPISSLFPPLDVAAGGGGASVSNGIADADAGGGQPGSGNPGRPESQGFSGPGACDVPGSGCAGGLAGATSIPAGGILLPDGWIRFPDGSLLPPQGTSPPGTP